MKKYDLLEALKKEIEKKELFTVLFIDTLKAYQKYNNDMESNEKKESFYTLLNVLNNYNDYISFTAIFFDIEKIIKKRLGDCISYNMILKAIEILEQRED